MSMERHFKASATKGSAAAFSKTRFFFSSFLNTSGLIALGIKGKTPLRSSTLHGTPLQLVSYADVVLVIVKGSKHFSALQTNHFFLRLAKRDLDMVRWPYNPLPWMIRPPVSLNEDIQAAVKHQILPYNLKT